MQLYEKDNGNDDSIEEITLEQITEMEEQCKPLIEMADYARKLSSDPKFKSVIMEEYFTVEPQRLGSLMASGKLPPRDFDSCVEDLKCIAHLRVFLTKTLEKGTLAQQQLDAMKEAREEFIAAQAEIE